MTKHTDLSDFGMTKTELPLLKRKVVIEPPDGDGIAGFVVKEAHLENRLPAYTTLRGTGHFYKKGKGWAISNSILNYLQKLGVERIYVHTGTKQTDDVYEFRASDYYHHGEDVPKEDLEYPQDPQTFVPLEAHNRKYEGHAAYLFYEEFEAALDKMGDRRWHP